MPNNQGLAPTLMTAHLPCGCEDRHCHICRRRFEKYQRAAISDTRWVCWQCAAQLIADGITAADFARHNPELAARIMAASTREASAARAEEAGDRGLAFRRLNDIVMGDSPASSSGGTIN
jgi:hypothetical protein